MKHSYIFSPIIVLLILHLSASFACAQQHITQTIKGTVHDLHTQEALTGATIIVIDSQPLVGTVADIDGNFSLKAELGRQSVQISYIGYEPVIIPEIMVTTGKEIVLEFCLRPSLTEMEGFVITPDVRKDKPLNDIATVSARSFTVEETRRYAGGLDDPARLVSAFAGVSVGNVQDNAIIVRGNSPKGVSWRLQGIDIPTPHHFAGGNVTGGGMVTLFSSQMLANSDFHTSAFPAEYGNGLAGVFDMNLRTGNKDEYEYTFQAGTMGIDFASEGPLGSDTEASYVFNYRYSTLGLLTDLQIIPTDQQFRYQDLSFNINIPTKSAGTFSFWGIGGLDLGTEPFETDSTAWETDWDRVSFDWDVAMGASGISHKYLTGKQTYLHTTLAGTGLSNRMDVDRQDNALIPQPDLLVSDKSGNINVTSYLHHRFNPRFTNETGVTYKRLIYNLDLQSTINNHPETYRTIINNQGGSDIWEFYSQSGWDLTSYLTLNMGINAGYFALSDNLSIDPRVGLSWSINPNHSLSAGYGSHRQLEDLKIYLIEQSNGEQIQKPNKDLGFAKAHHFVLAYDWHINKNIRLKIEPFVQFIHDAPGIADSSFSMINYKQDWAFSDALENNSVGRNMGIDFTLERYLANDYYHLITASLLSSRYKADDGVWRNTRFNRNYVGNVLVGKEFFFQDNRKMLGINGRLSYLGGERVSPILHAQSEEEQRAIFDENDAFSKQLASTIYADLSVTYRTNHAGYSSVWALQVKNLLGQAMPEGYNYNYRSRDVQLDKSVMVIPSLSYSIEF